MPELPEIETVRRGLAPAMEGRTVVRAEVRREGLRRPFPERLAQRLEGARVERLGRRSKYLLVDLSTGETLLVHLGMSGRMTVSGEALGAFVHDAGGLTKHDHLVLHMSAGASSGSGARGPAVVAVGAVAMGDAASPGEGMGGPRVADGPDAALPETEERDPLADGGARVTLNDARRFGVVDLWPTRTLAEHPLLRGLGPEPLSDAFDGPALAARLRGRRTSMKAALMDQRVVAGLGNIYVCEALHRARIDPRRQAGRVSRARAEALVPAIRATLQDAIEAGGSTLRDHRRADGTLGTFQQAHRAYGREGAPCPTEGCGGTIRRVVQAGRSTFFCPACQR